MNTGILILLQLIVALGLINVWLVRFNKASRYRGGSAKNLADEFTTYGLPGWAVYAVGTIKISAAILLIIGIWYPSLNFIAAVVISILMIGAVLMHFKVQDPIVKSMPAAVMLCGSLILSIISYGDM